MKPVDLDTPTIVALRDPQDPGRSQAVFSGSYGGALILLGALPIHLRDRAVVELTGPAAQVVQDVGTMLAEAWGAQLH